jgi:hypothetical protein
VRRLSQHSQEFSEQIRQQVEKAKVTIGEARRIVSTAASTDLTMTIDAKGRTDVVLRDIGQMDTHIAQSLQDISGIASQISDHVGMTVRSLQFEDIINQLLGYTDRRLDRLEGFVSALQTQLEQLTATTTTEADYGTRLLHIRASLGHLRDTWDTEDHKPTHQVSMSAGDIELF